MARLSDYLSLIRFSHSVFALPFALIALLVATGGRPGWRLLLLVVAAVVLARTAAMAYNRYADRRLDADNPRTAGREIPRGSVRPGAALALALGAGALFLLVCWLLGPLLAALGVPVLLWLYGYSHAKRFTAAAHLWLGIALGLAPVAAWVAARGTLTGDLLPALVLGLGVTAWVAGFDVLYACQDEDFDRRAGLRSIPVRFGRRGALRMAALLHLLALPLFAGFGLLAGTGLVYHLGVVAAALLLLWQHLLLQRHGLAGVQAVFFANGLVSLGMLVAAAADLYL